MQQKKKKKQYKRHRADLQLNLRKRMQRLFTASIYRKRKDTKTTAVRVIPKHCVQERSCMTDINALFSVMLKGNHYRVVVSAKGMSNGGGGRRNARKNSCPSFLHFRRNTATSISQLPPAPTDAESGMGGAGPVLVPRFPPNYTFPPYT